MRIQIIKSYPKPVLELEAGDGSFFVGTMSAGIPGAVELYLTDQDFRALFEALGDHLFNEEREMTE